MNLINIWIILKTYNSIKIYNDLNKSKLKDIIDKSNNMSNTVNKCICEILKQVSNLNKNLLEI